MTKTKKEIALEYLDVVINDCEDAAETLFKGEFLHWDGNCYSSMADLLEAVRKYITENT